MRSSFGKNIKVSIWGGSHEPAIGVDIDGLPIGTEIDVAVLQSFMDRRAPGNSPFATKRKEPDVPVAAGGLDGDMVLKVSGERVSFEIRNTDTRSADYKALASVPRPGHADYTARLRYGDELNMAGGGPFSARMTAPLCIAGGIAKQILAKQGITIGAHLYSVAAVKDKPLDPVGVSSEMLAALSEKNFPVVDESAGEKMKATILAARNALDSVGGIVEAAVCGLPRGLGGAMYDGIESALAPILFGIPAVKGVEFGAGFGAAEMMGSENNDAFYFENACGENTSEQGSEPALCVKTRTNNHGGILGGITTGMPLITRIAFKPTPSIAREQDSVDLDTKENTKLVVKGRHDPCVAVRAVPVVEAALAIGILDCMMEATTDR